MSTLLSLDQGHYTWGAKYICFKPVNAEYIRLAQAPEGKEDSPEWIAFAEQVVDLLNEAKND